MLQELKEMTRRLFRLKRPPQVVSLTTIVHDLPTTNEGTIEPREIPRPARNDSKNSTKDPLNSFKETMTSSPEIPVAECAQDCTCINCRELLDNYADCIVCMEPLQGAGIFSCPTCGNILCWRCSEKLKLCAFCRTDLGPEPRLRPRNLAMERLLARLSLPCRNARWGCNKKFQYKDRIQHEPTCPFAPTGCPLYKYCGWHGDSKDIARHLKDSHDLTLVAANGINIEISDFRAKVDSTTDKTRKYTVSLACHGHIYICKIVMYQYKLKLIFCQISGSFQSAKPRQLEKFGAMLEITSPLKTIKGIVPIFHKQKFNKELEIPCSALLSSVRRSQDVVNISITIKPLVYDNDDVTTKSKSVIS